MARRFSSQRSEGKYSIFQSVARFLGCLENNQIPSPWKLWHSVSHAIREKTGLVRGTRSPGFPRKKKKKKTVHGFRTQSGEAEKFSRPWNRSIEARTWLICRRCCQNTLCERRDTVSGNRGGSIRFRRGKKDVRNSRETRAIKTTRGEKVDWWTTSTFRPTVQRKLFRRSSLQTYSRRKFEKKGNREKRKSDKEDAGSCF